MLRCRRGFEEGVELLIWNEEEFARNINDENAIIETDWNTHETGIDGESGRSSVTLHLYTAIHSTRSSACIAFDCVWWYWNRWRKCSGLLQFTEHQTKTSRRSYSYDNIQTSLLHFAKQVQSDIFIVVRFRFNLLLHLMKTRQTKRKTKEHMLHKLAKIPCLEWHEHDVSSSIPPLSYQCIPRRSIVHIAEHPRSP